MSKVDAFQRIVDQFDKEADFLVIYIQEAHALDQDKFDTNYHQINSHKTLDDRIFAAKLLELNEPTFDIVVDPMTDECNMAYGGLYERLYVIKDGKIEYQGERGPSGYHLNEVEEWLLKYRENTERKVPKVNNIK